MRYLLVALATIGLGACETMPEFLQQPTTPGRTPTATSPAASTTAPATPARYTAPPDQQLLELERQLARTAQEEGLGGAIASVISPGDGMVIRPGVTYSTADEISRGLAAPAGAGPIYWQPDRVHVSSSGDMGMTSGRYVQVMSGSEAVQGRYVVVWRRDSAGEWKALTETRVPDPPRAAAAPRRR
jgi:hypothetical protein